MKPGHTGWRHLIHSTRYSIKGLNAAFHNEAAFRQELGLCVVMVPLAIWLGHSPVEWILLIGSCLMVLIVELLNTAVEAVVDRIGPERHDLSGRAKDMGSAAVLFCIAMIVLSWGTIAWQNYATR